MPSADAGSIVWTARNGTELRSGRYRHRAMKQLWTVTVSRSWVFLLAVLVGACTGSATVPSPTPKPVLITQPDQAVARVILVEPRLAGLTAFDPNLIGLASWYTVTQASGVGAFVVEVRVGWGDCPAGCISEHKWTYAVVPDGVVSVISESGDAVPPEAWPSQGAGRTGIAGTATAGPVCPVEKNPPDPACAPRPVAGAVVVIRDASGKEIGRVTTARDGTYFADVPAGGYVIEPQPAQGLLGTPGPTSVVVTDGATSRIDLAYDTGIR